MPILFFLEDRSEDMLWKLREAGIGQRPVIFVGHSMGGLIIKQERVTSQILTLNFHLVQRNLDGIQISFGKFYA